MNVVIAPNAFKGSLSASEVARAIADGVRRARPDAAIKRFPMADGGEGTLDAILSVTGGERQSARVPGADGAPVDAQYGVVERAGERVAVIEIAQVVGWAAMAQAATPVADRSTRGAGLLVRHCLDRGLRHFLIGLGGSSTNDGGAGLLAALGVRLLDGSGNEVAPTPSGLAALARLDFGGLDPRLGDSRLVLLSDVANPLAGANGATRVFGPQKGVSPQEIPGFDAALARLGALGDAWARRALAQQPGAGAAGGLGFAFQLLGAEYRSGAAAVADWLGLEPAIRVADRVFTGEGYSETQTLGGKAPYIVAQLAARHRVPVTLISGGIAPEALPALRAHFDQCLSLAGEGVTAEQAKRDAARLIADRAASALRDRP